MKKSAFKFSSFQEPTLSPFEKLFNIFKELIIHTSGDFDEAIEWLYLAAKGHRRAIFDIKNKKQNWLVP